jgi:DNA-binding transcriptional ArsR family regulator
MVASFPPDTPQVPCGVYSPASEADVPCTGAFATADLSDSSEASYASDVSETAELDGLLRALANPHRRQIVQACWGVEHTAGELAELLDLAPASASEHLKVLRKHRLVEMRVEGTFRIYRSRPEELARLAHLLTATFPPLPEEAP